MPITLELPPAVADRLTQAAHAWGMVPITFVTALVGLSVGGLQVLDEPLGTEDIDDAELTPEQKWREFEVMRDNMNETRLPSTAVFPINDVGPYTPPFGVKSRRRLPGAAIATATANPVRADQR